MANIDSEPIIDLLYGELSEEEAARLRAQIAADPEAAAQLAAWTQVRELVGQLPEVEPDPQVHYDILRAAREAAQPAKKGVWAWLSEMVMNPAFAGLALMVLAGGTFLLVNERAEAPGNSVSDRMAQAEAPPVSEQMADKKDEAKSPKAKRPADSKARGQIAGGEAKNDQKTALGDELKTTTAEVPAKAATAKPEVPANDGVPGFGSTEGKNLDLALGDVGGKGEDPKGYVAPEGLEKKKVEREKAKEAKPVGRKVANAPRKPAPARPKPKPSPKPKTKSANKKRKRSAKKVRDPFFDAPTDAPKKEPPPAEEQRRDRYAAPPPAAEPEPEPVQAKAETAPAPVVQAPSAPRASGGDEDDRDYAPPPPPEPAATAANAPAPTPAPRRSNRGGSVVQGAADDSVVEADVAREESEANEVEVGEEKAATVAAVDSERADKAKDSGRPASLTAARQARNQGNLRAAVRSYEEFLAGYPRHREFAQALYETAQSYERLGEFGKAEKLYRTVRAAGGRWIAKADEALARLNTRVAKPAKAKAKPKAKADEKAGAAAPAEALKE